MPALDRLRGTRVVADAVALDALLTALPATALALRFAPDDVFVIDVYAGAIDVADGHAIVVDEAGFVGGWGALDDIVPHIEWQLPTERPVLAQGSIAGVPAKLWLPGDGAGEGHGDGAVLVVTAAAYADTLGERLGWRA